MSDFSSFLFARPSFTEGVARIFDFGNYLNEYNYSETPELADRRAFAADWSALAEDVRFAAAKIAASGAVNGQQKIAN
jgi:hypothetical protein